MLLRHQHKGSSGAVLLASGILFTAIALTAWISLILATSRADVILQMLMTSNAAPGVESVSVSYEADGPQLLDITLTENGLTDIHVHGTVSDPNGCGDLSQVSVVLYRADLGAGCVTDENNCYRASTTTFSGCGFGDADAVYDVVMPVQYFADPTDAGSPFEVSHWLAQVTASDGAGLTGQRTGPGVEMDSLAALEVTPLIDFGTLRLGQVSAPEPVSLKNTGNRAIISNFASEGDMACSDPASSLISTTLLHLASAAQVSSSTGDTNPPNPSDDSSASYSADVRQDIWNNGQVMDAAALRTTGEIIPKKTGVADSTGILYFILKIPDSSVQGACSTVLQALASVP